MIVRPSGWMSAAVAADIARHPLIDALWRAAMAISLLAVATAAARGNADCTRDALEGVYETAQATFALRTVAAPLVFPTSLVFLPGGDALVTERVGRIQRYWSDFHGATEIRGLPAGAGLLDIALHPDYPVNGWLYLSQAVRTPRGNSLRLLRGGLAGDRLHGVEVLFSTEPEPAGIHHAGRLLFLPDGTLLLTLGDRLDRAAGQDLLSHYGSILRLRDDGAIPPDNPFVADEAALPEIYSYGHRNVQGIALSPVSATIWAAEHGPRGGDELNVLRAGANYGWPLASLGTTYAGRAIAGAQSQAGIVGPILSWTPAIAPSGITFYWGDLFEQWRGDLFVGSLSQRHLRRLEIGTGTIVGEEILLAELHERVRDVRAGEDGDLYVLTDDARGRVLELSPCVTGKSLSVSLRGGGRS